MSTTPRSPDRRGTLVTSAAAAASTLIPAQAHAATSDAIHSFRIEVPDEQLADLRARLTATRWPDRETVADEAQGVPLATMRELARYWGKDYNWRKIETKLNALPQFTTKIDEATGQGHAAKRPTNATQGPKAAVPTREAWATAPSPPQHRQLLAKNNGSENKICALAKSCGTATIN